MTKLTRCALWLMGTMLLSGCGEGTVRTVFVNSCADITIPFWSPEAQSAMANELAAMPRDSVVRSRMAPDAITLRGRVKACGAREP